MSQRERRCKTTAYSRISSALFCVIGGRARAQPGSRFLESNSPLPRRGSEVSLARDMANTGLILEVAGSGLAVRYEPTEGAVQTEVIDKKHNRVKIDGGRVSYRSHPRFDDAVIFPGFALSGGRSYMYFDESGDRKSVV